MGNKKHYFINKGFVVIITINLLLISGLYSVSLSRADEPDPQKVPPPQVGEDHQKDTVNSSESWLVNIDHGNLSLSFGARNSTGNQGTGYQYNIGYWVNRTRLYLAQFGLGGNATAFKIGNMTYRADLANCHHFEVTRSHLIYNGTVPELFSNITFKRIRVHSGLSGNSTFDLTIFHHFKFNWNVSSAKIAFQFNLAGTKFYDMNDTEYPTGTPFGVEIMYNMALWYTPDPEHQNPLMPVGFKNESMQYNIVDGTGKLVTISRLNVLNNFTTYGTSGKHESTGYSSINYGWRSEVTHGYPNLTYKETQRIESDPQITSYHDRVQFFQGDGGEGMVGHIGPGPNPALVAAVWIPIIVTIVAGVVIYRRRRKNKKSKEVKKNQEEDKNEQMDEKDKEIIKLKSELAELKKK